MTITSRWSPQSTADETTAHGDEDNTNERVPVECIDPSMVSVTDSMSCYYDPSDLESATQMSTLQIRSPNMTSSKHHPVHMQVLVSTTPSTPVTVSMASSKPHTLKGPETLEISLSHDANTTRMKVDEGCHHMPDSADKISYKVGDSPPHTLMGPDDEVGDTAGAAAEKGMPSHCRENQTSLTTPSLTKEVKHAHSEENQTSDSIGNRCTPQSAPYAEAGTHGEGSDKPDVKERSNSAHPSSSVACDEVQHQWVRKPAIKRRGRCGSTSLATYMCYPQMVGAASMVQRRRPSEGRFT